jgi:hypothetical protein
MSPHIRYPCLRSVQLRRDDKGERGDDKRKVYLLKETPIVMPRLIDF